MKPQASINAVTEGNDTRHYITVEKAGQTEKLEQPFSDYQQALDYVLEQGWQLKREPLQDSLHVETRFLKP
jgi:D-serine deaminase-like pyridoxal phosphate-dependent protein